MAKKRKSGSSRRRRRNKNPSAAWKKSSSHAARVRAARKGARTRARRRGHRGKARFVAGRKTRTRTYHVGVAYKRPFHVRGRSAHRRKNPSDTLMGAAIAVGVGVLTSVAASYLLDTLSTSVTSLQSSTYQDGVLLVGAGAAAYWVKNPAIAAGIATGLLLIPAAKLVYSVFPSLASANTYNPQNPSVTMTSLHAPMSSLHRPMGSLHRPMGAVFDLGEGSSPFNAFGDDMGALNRGSAMFSRHV